MTCLARSVLIAARVLPPQKFGPSTTNRTPTVVPASKCKLRLLKLERVKDYLLMEEEFVARQEQVRHGAAVIPPHAPASL
jgi:26S proteasome regulatory subunit T2